MKAVDFIKQNAHITQWVLWGMDSNDEWHRIDFFDIIIEKYGSDCLSKMIESNGTGWLWVYNKEEYIRRQNYKGENYVQIQ